MKNKCIVILILSFALCSALVILSFAHPGKTDEYGGHYDYEAGEYHYHHGYPAHQHPDGVCPYNFDDQTDHSSGSSSYSNNEYKEYERQIEQEQQEYERTEKEKRQGAHAGELLGLDKGKESGYTDGILNREKKLPSDYSPLFSAEYSYMDESLNYQLAFEKQFIESYEKAYNEAYDEGHKIWQKKHDKTVKIIVWSIIGFLITVFVIWVVIVNRKEKKRLAEEKAKQEQIAKMAQILKNKQVLLRQKESKIKTFLIKSMQYKKQQVETKEFLYQATMYRKRYEGKSYNQLLDLPENIYYCNGKFKSLVDSDNYKPLIVYRKNNIVKTLHSKKGCSGAYTPCYIFDFTKKSEYSLCLRCGKIEHLHMLSSYPLWYINYVEFEKLFNKYNINRKKRNVTICLPDAPEEPKYE